MQQKFKAHRLLTNGNTNIALIDKLNITDTEDKLLVECRADVRKYLKEGFQQLRSNASIKFQEFEDDIRNLNPKFWTQGSYAYKTMNDPATNPPQQIDLDDGVYFPMALLDGKPLAVKNKLLKLIKLILTELADNKGWGVSEKTTCLRLEVNSRVHIDVPVYAIPEQKYVMLKAAMESRNNFADSSSDLEFMYLDPDEVHLARWDNDDWIKSDPKELHEWFISKTKLHGKRFLRRVCRYMKAWRDHQWDKGGPSSITLMVVVAKVFDDNLMINKKEFASDCEALLAIANELPAIFNTEIKNPIADDEIIFPRDINQIEVEAIRQKVAEFSNSINSLCYSQTEQQVVNEFMRIFGSRLPNKPEWVERYTVGDVVRNSPHVTSTASTAFKEEHRSG
ncbi:MAG: hypothetical protein COA74_15860 [Gammaproteobacteria bacterium]|nr:MAG: hypothetical protein COA74_15860 [Gammaproteobacteria bacterium]